MFVCLYGFTIHAWTVTVLAIRLGGSMQFMGMTEIMKKLITLVDIGNATAQHEAVIALHTFISDGPGACGKVVHSPEFGPVEWHQSDQFAFFVVTGGTATKSEDWLTGDTDDTDDTQHPCRVIYVADKGIPLSAVLS